MKKYILLIIGFFVLFPIISFASIDTNLTYGSRGVAVQELQDFLISKGFLTTQTSGNFFSLTRNAVIAYQTSVGLPATGFVGPMTRAKINGELSVANASSTADQLAETGTTTPPTTSSNATTLQQQIQNLMSQLAQLNIKMSQLNQNTQTQQIQQTTQTVQNNIPVTTYNPVPPQPAPIPTLNPTPAPIQVSVPAPIPTPPQPTPVIDPYSDYVFTNTSPVVGSATQWQAEISIAPTNRDIRLTKAVFKFSDEDAARLDTMQPCMGNVPFIFGYFPSNTSRNILSYPIQKIDENTYTYNASDNPYDTQGISIPHGTDRPLTLSLCATVSDETAGALLNRALIEDIKMPMSEWVIMDQSNGKQVKTW